MTSAFMIGRAAATRMVARGYGKIINIGSLTSDLARATVALYTVAKCGVDGQGRPLGFVLTGGEASDYNAVPDLLAMPVGKPRLFLADKGYDGDFLREELLIHGIRPVIQPKANRKNPPACDFRAYKDRNRIERMFSRLKKFRRVATRYDKTRKSFSAFLALAAAKIWLPYFVNRNWYEGFTPYAEQSRAEPIGLVTKIFAYIFLKEALFLKLLHSCSMVRPP